MIVTLTDQVINATSPVLISIHFILHYTNELPYTFNHF